MQIREETDNFINPYVIYMLFFAFVVILILIFQYKIIAPCPRCHMPRCNERMRFAGNVLRRYRPVSAGCLQEKW